MYSSSPSVPDRFLILYFVFLLIFTAYNTKSIVLLQFIHEFDGWDGGEGYRKREGCVRGDFDARVRVARQYACKSRLSCIRIPIPLFGCGGVSTLRQHLT